MNKAELDEITWKAFREGVEFQLEQKLDWKAGYERGWAEGFEAGLRKGLDFQAELIECPLAGPEAT